MRSAVSLLVRPNRAIAPRNLSPPRIDGPLLQDRSVTLYDGAWSGSPAITRRLLADGVPVATGTSYQCTAGEVGANLTLEVTATANGRTTVATSPVRGPVMTEQEVYDEAVAAMVSAGLDAILDAVWVVGGSTKAGGQINQLDPGTHDLTQGGTGPAFTAFAGIKSGGSGNYFEGIDPSLGGVNFLQDDNSFGVWVITDVAASTGVMGRKNFLLNPQASPDIARYRNAASNTDSATGVTDARGIFICTRTGPAGFQIYRNKDLIKDHARASVALTDGAFRLTGWTDDAGSTHNDTARTLCLGLQGGGFTWDQVITFTDGWGLCFNRLGVVTPEIARLMFSFDEAGYLIVTADVEYGFEPGLKTRLVVTRADDVGFTRPIFDGDEQPAEWDNDGLFMPVKHRMLPPTDTDILFEIRIIRP
jgi:hypothetical protein